MSSGTLSAVIILAAGKGTRMQSDKAKVLHELNGKPMINHVVEAARNVVGDNIVVVVGHQQDTVKKAVLKTMETHFAIQEEQLGTGHAVMCALPEVKKETEDVIILCGDVPLIKSETIARLMEEHNAGDNAVTVLAVETKNPSGYGRMVVGHDGGVHKIVEEADATEAEKQINIINTGIYCVNHSFLINSLQQINNNNAQGELYLTDIIGIAYNEKKMIGMYAVNDLKEVTGVNTIEDLEALQRC